MATTANNYQNKYELINSMNETIKKVHTITSNNSDTYYNKYEFKISVNYERNKLFDGFGEYVNYISPILAKSIIKSMYSTIYKVKDKESSTDEKTVYKWIVGTNYESTKKIIDSGYTDTMYFDIIGEISLYLCENVSNIDILVCGSWENIKFMYSFDNEIFLAIYKQVRKYLYKNSQRQINKEYNVMVLDCDGENYEIDTRVNSKDFITYTYNEIEKTHTDILDILDNIAIYCYYSIDENERRKYKFETIKKVLLSLAKGETFKQSGLSNNSYWKYKKMLISCFDKSTFNKLYNQIIANTENDKYYSANNNHNYMIISDNIVEWNDAKYCKNAIIDTKEVYKNSPYKTTIYDLECALVTYNDNAINKYSESLPQEVFEKVREFENNL